MALPQSSFAQCEAKFGLAKDTVCAEISIAFTDSSTGTAPITYLWDFGDAASPSNFSNAQHPTHNFITTGTLTVRLIITDNGSCSDTVTRTVVVRPSPVAAFARYDNCKQTVAKFINTSSWNAADTVAEWKWKFGNGDSSVLKNPLYTYPDTGNFNISLVAKSVLGCIDTVKTTLRVYSKPVITIADTQFCAGNSVNFGVQLLESSGLQYNWRFGDGNGSVTAAPLHTYNTGGVFYPQLKITHGGTDSCFARFDSVRVFDLPIIKFSLVNDTLCYHGNNACILDSTDKGLFGAGIKNRTLVFGDGFIDNTTPISIKTICHQYTDPSGGSYPLTIEATDSNQCFSRKQVANAVIILPDFVPAFSITENKTCFSNLVTITNTSAFDSASLDKFEWTYGDGATDSTDWLVRQHLYTTSGNYTIRLKATDTFGCVRTTAAPTALQSVVLNINPSLNRDTSCFFNNNFIVTNPVNFGATATWQFGDGGIDTNWVTNYAYPGPGNYTIRLRVQAQSCDTLITLRTVTVLGPRANIGTPRNRFQCLIHDTVYFTGTLQPYLSNHGPAPGNVQRIWSFGDAFAPQCTTDTKNGINVGANCNFSRDSMDVKHWYTPGKEGCYFPRLQLRDTLWGCLDTSRTTLALMPPKAGPDTAAVPPIPGLSFFKPDCLGPEGIKSKIANLSNTQPACARELFWVMWDSLCAVQSGSFNSGWRLNDSFNNYLYNSPPCDTGGRVTIGLIVRNGQDTAGQFCLDTAWYHHVFQFNDLYPAFTDDFDPAVSRCPGTTIKARVSDTAQDGILSYQWTFSDGSPPIITLTPTEISHTFLTPGTHSITLTLVNADGCTGFHEEFYSLGFDGDFEASLTTICAGDTIDFEEDIFYFDIGGARWRDPARQLAGKEQLSWDFGDGRGFVTTGNTPSVIFDKVGVYTVKLALKDSSGCMDTIVKPDLFTVNGTYARFFTDDTIVCPQLVQLIDSSRIFDPANFINIPPGDSIAKWEWSFGVGKPKSFTKNPYHDFAAGGDYHLKLKVENTFGCRDSTEGDVFVKGPVPSFIFTSDTTGCSPLRVTFKNLSVNANKYTWNFRDANSNTLTTLSDSDVYNIYTGGGLYKPYLQAESSEFDASAGHNVTCRAVFPDTSLQSIRLVAVNATPVANFGTVNNCSSFSLNFHDSSVIDSGTITSHLWIFGDGDSSTLANPSHSYSDTGTYSVLLYVWASSGCRDSIAKKVSVAPPPTAKFVYNDTCFSHTTQFTDSSLTDNAFVVRWEWAFGDGTTSLFQNPPKQYLLPGTYNVKLKILTNAGCEDSVMQDIVINPLPLVGFTAPNQCRLETASFVNGTTVSSGSLSYSWRFGDGSTSTSASPTHAYAADGTFNVKLIATANGCSDSVTNPITIHPLPVADFDMNVQNQCVNTNGYHFINKATIASGVLGADWNFGDGNTSNATDPDYHYTTSAIYSVRLVSSSGFGCRDTVQKDVRVFPKPTADFSINDTAQCLNINSFELTNASADTGILTYNWNFGNSTTSADTNPTVIYGADGFYNIRLITSTAFPCRDTITKTVRVLPVPASSFTINDTGQCVNTNQFIYTNTSTISAGTLSAQWQYGDGQSTSAISASHTYALDSNYAIRLVSISDRNCRDTTIHTVTVFPKPLPAFSINDAVQCVNTDLFNFTNQTTIKYGTLAYTWYFGTGDSSTATSIAYGYTADTTYYVQLKAVSDQNCTDTLSKPVIVLPKPQAGFIINDTGQCLNTNSYQFTSQTTMKTGGLRYHWNFGNGDTSVLQNPLLVYPADGIFNVRLIAQSDSNCYDTVTTAVMVFPLPQVMFAINDSGQCVNDNLFNFTNQTTISAGFIHAYYWNFGDGNNSTLTHTSNTYNISGTYTPRLVAESSRGCFDTLFKTVLVFPKPVANFTVNDTAQCLNINQFNFTNTSTDTGSLTYNWNFGNSTSSAQTNPSVVYAGNGYYNVRLIATNQNACNDTLIDTIRVLPIPAAQFSIDDTGQCVNNNTFNFTNTSAISLGTLSASWAFGDAGASTAYNPAHSYTVDTQFRVTLISISDRNCRDTIDHTLTVFPKPFPRFAVNDSDQCVNTNSYQFTNQTTLKYGTNTYSWKFGDAGTSTSANPNHVYVADNNFIVRLIATSDNNCLDSIERQVTVFPKPQAAFIINDTGQCLNTNNYQFTDQTFMKSGGLRYDWKFGDGGASTLQNPSHVYALDTQYTVTLVARSDFDCYDTISTVVNIFPVPTVKFAVNDSDQCVNENLYQFTNQSSIKNGTMTYLWWFGTEGTGTNQNEQFTFNGDIAHAVKLKAISNQQCTDSVSKSIMVLPKPNVQFAINDTGQCVNANKFDFTNQSTIKFGTLTYSWDFANGETATSTDTSVVYSLYGKYKPRLIALSDLNCKDTLLKDISVYPKPTVQFTINDTDQCLTGNNYQMANTSNIAEGYMHYKWHWGNGDTANTAQPAYTYPLDSSYIIKLVVTSGWSCKDSLDKPVVVYPQPQIAFAINDTDQCVNANFFTYTNQSKVKYGTLQYAWDFGNGESCNCLDSSIVYTYDTVYRVVQQATTNNGCVDTAGRYIKVQSKPNPKFSVNDTDQCVNANFFQFFNETTIKEGWNTYKWTFGEGSSDTNTFTSKIYSLDTTYVVKLLAMSENNCRDSITRTMLVFPKPKANFTVNDSTQCININNFVFTNTSTIKYGTLGYNWNFGDTFFSSNISPVHIYNNHGPYTVTLYAQSNFNCFDTTTRNMILYPKPNPDFNIDDTAQCLKVNQFAFTDTSTIASGTYTTRWTYSDGRVFTTTNVSRKFNNPGTYQAKLLLTSNFQCTDSVEKQVIVYPHPNPNFFNLKKYYCTDYSLEPFIPLVPGGTFFGKNMQNDTFVPNILGPDTVRYEVSVNGCLSDTVKYTRVHPLPTLNIGPDTSLCRREFLVFDVSFPNSTYLWQDGIESPKYKVIQPGKYKVTLFNLCDTLTQEINVVYKDYDCNFFFPTAFTPDGDGINDVFYPYIEDAEEIHMQIFDRWGGLVFESKEMGKGWDGTYQGMPAQIDVYVWKISLLINQSGFRYEHSASGNVTLMR